MTSMELEVQRLLAHIGRIQARRFLKNPECPTGWGDFPENRDDAIARIQREARKQVKDKQ